MLKKIARARMPRVNDPTTLRHKPDLVERTRAAVCYVNARGGNPDLALTAFMGIMHPEVNHQRVKELIGARKDCSAQRHRR